jgi:type IV pilus assembly protein PilO
MAIQLTKQQQQYIGVGVVMFLVWSAMYARFFWLPISQKRAELDAEIADTKHKIAAAQAQANHLKTLQDELVTLNQQAIEAERRLPKTKSVPDILVALTGLAQANRVSIQSFSPGPQKSQQYFIELSYPMMIKGSYHDIGRFLAAVALEERIFNVKDVLYPGEGADGAMAVSFVLLTYQYKG